MAIWGGDGSTYEQMIYADTIEDLKTLLETDLGDNKPYKYIGLPKTYDGDKVLDLRKKGWCAGSGSPYINMPYYSGMQERYLYGNGWTILGASILDGNFFAKGWLPTLYIYDLTIKNAYVYANSYDSSIFGGYKYYLNNCKVSATLDGSTSKWAAVFYGEFDSAIEQTSMNIKLHCQALPNYGWFGTIKNSLIHFETSNKGLFNYATPLINGWSIFSKIEGTVKPYNTDRTLTISFTSNSGYNVVDLEVINGGSGSAITYSLSAPSSSPCIYNSEKVRTNVTVSTSGAMFPVTSAEMVSKAHLESINFLVGDAPTL